ncbi:3-methyl-2-oxobutanoate hydroxymethyltransferase [candidate division MSBL1 archaeon SCGC-AAA259E19]|uniref:3-methyl-2-oxobutanoate hydroxymethyltransferase n=1 Tax=candidate division MSBL1 archaeon SCGC-AAA259E19 TaxID=1698264 RepID=A0A133UNP7_9EURY|nr:3-methyl-2-oxobutanoate hydroxymethyltransferase [candidate division MSBL1 archaeon SCGC-AAA259E19]
MGKKKITASTLQDMKDRNEKITMLTAYDYPTARLLDEAEIDCILVGDSLGNVILGYDNTLPVNMGEMLHHTRAVTRGVDHSLVIADMPFLAHKTGHGKAIRNAGRFIQEAEAEAVKVEGGSESLEPIEEIVDSGIPVMGHLGLTPQRILQFGGYRIQGKTPEKAKKILEDALKLEEVGVFSVVLESIPQELGKIITERLEIPTIGIGAGPHCDGQVLVLHDILGLSEISPKFVKEYEDLGSSLKEAAKSFQNEVKKSEFPTSKHSYNLEKGKLEKLKKFIEKTLKSDLLVL